MEKEVNKVILRYERICKQYPTKVSKSSSDHDDGWHAVDEMLPEQDVEVIALCDPHDIGMLRISFAHIVDNDSAVDFNGWNIPGVVFWRHTCFNERIEKYTNND